MVLPSGLFYSLLFLVDSAVYTQSETKDYPHFLHLFVMNVPYTGDILSGISILSTGRFDKWCLY
jgi:hypothetical protein